MDPSDGVSTLINLAQVPRKRRAVKRKGGKRETDTSIRSTERDGHTTQTDGEG